MDWAGNVGERSAPLCLDSTDPADPSVELVDYDPPCSGALCAVAAAGAGRGPTRPLIALAGLALLAARSATRRRAPTMR